MPNWHCHVNKEKVQVGAFSVIVKLRYSSIDPVSSVSPSTLHSVHVSMSPAAARWPGHIPRAGVDDLIRSEAGSRVS